VVAGCWEQPLLILGKELTVFMFLNYFVTQELHKREEIIARRETMVAEKSELEMKKLRSSQVVNKVKYYRYSS